MAISKFNKYESAVFNAIAQDVVQIRSMIEQICIQGKVGPDKLPPSMVPTHQLYDILVSYEKLYEKVLDISLVQTGNPRFNRNNIH